MLFMWSLRKIKKIGHCWDIKIKNVCYLYDLIESIAVYIIVRRINDNKKYIKITLLKFSDVSKAIVETLYFINCIAIHQNIYNQNYKLEIETLLEWQPIKTLLDIFIKKEIKHDVKLKIENRKFMQFFIVPKTTKDIAKVQS